MSAFSVRSRVIALIAIVLASGPAPAQTLVAGGLAVPFRGEFGRDFSPGYHLQASTALPLRLQAFRLAAGFTYDQWPTKSGLSGGSHAACLIANPTIDLSEHAPWYFFAGGAYCQIDATATQLIGVMCPAVGPCGPSLTSAERGRVFGYDAGVGTHRDHLFAEFRLMHASGQSSRSWFPLALGYRF